MKPIQWRVFITISFVVCANLACLFGATAAKIVNAKMVRDGDAPTKTFSSNETFYCSVTLSNAPEDTTIKAVWTAVNVVGMEPNFIIDETEIKSGTGTVKFRLENTNSWPKGEYKVDILLNGEIDQTLEFTVE